MSRPYATSILLLPLAALSSAATTVEMQDDAPTPAEAEMVATPGEPAAMGIFTAANVGTQGVGLDVGYEFNKYLKMRLRAAWLKYDYNSTWSNVDVKSSLSGNNAGLILDIHPFANTFRLSVGVNLSPLRVDAYGFMDAPHEIYTLGNYEYRVNGRSGQVHGRYSWRTVQPYLGVGWSCNGTGESGFFFSMDLGVNIMGKGKMDVSASANVMQRRRGTLEWEAMDLSLLSDSLRREGENFFEIADRLVVYPVLQIGMGFRF